ncbi:hypothetical protein [Hymenobacter terrenus]|uniref:hypothetical protein n=1 Tax=Hymenobacter terrenus TaxID=1629124 RepID=UPI000AA4ECA3|nr:hypothetical protein [Hymenobacter terrenus]
MAIIITWVRAVGLFYGNVAPFMLGITALLLGFVLLPALYEGWADGLLPALLLIKLITSPVVWYLSEQMRPNQYWLYYNLGVSRRRLWVGVGVLDGLLFLGLTVGLQRLYS